MEKESTVKQKICNPLENKHHENGIFFEIKIYLKNAVTTYKVTENKYPLTAYINGLMKRHTKGAVSFDRSCKPF